MSDEAEVAGAIAKGIVQGASQGLNDLLINAFGPAATEFGLMLQGEVRTMRLKRGVQLFAMAKEKLDKIGAQVRRVPEKLMLTILSEATLEDDEGLRQIWANLLASAANSAEESKVYPSFPTILKELTPRDVKFLDALFTDALEFRRREQDRKVEEVMLHPKRVNDIYAQVCLGVRLADVHGIKALEVLEATGRGRRLSMDTFERNNIVMKIFKVIRPELDNDPELGMTYSFTGLGACFVSACRGPHAAA